MKCPNCGADMKDGLLYCEACGEDIHIVPDFEPELELNMKQSLEHIAKDVVHEGLEPETTDDSGQNDTKIRSAVRPVIGWVGMILLAGLLIAGGIRIYQHYSVGYQAEQAKRAVASGKYDKAIRFYTRAIELDELDVDLKLDLAEVYFQKNDKENYESWLRIIAVDPNADREQLESVYGKLIAIYRAKEDYQTINDMLLACTNDSIRTAYQSYLAEAPQFSVPAGDYDEVKALKLTITGKGNIYYTLDGKTPDADKLLYTTPILLENGSYVIKAIYINENGVSSDVAEARYRISVTELEEPELSVDSGEYDEPMYISVLNDQGNVYYTTDGSVPDMESALYTEPIPMPLGHSNFKFARLEYGRASAVVDRDFDLDVHASVLPEEAVKMVHLNAYTSGKIYDDAGHFDDSPAYYQYQYLHLANIGESIVSYVIAEVFVDPDGMAARTGNYFAVDVYTGDLYRLRLAEGKYQIIDE